MVSLARAVLLPGVGSAEVVVTPRLMARLPSSVGVTLKVTVAVAPDASVPSVTSGARARNHRVALAGRDLRENRARERSLREHDTGRRRRPVVGHLRFVGERAVELSTGQLLEYNRNIGGRADGRVHRRLIVGRIELEFTGDHLAGV